MKNKTLRVLLAQTDSHLGNVKKNLQRHIEVLESYRGKADIVVFPELSLTGYNVGNQFSNYALTRDDPLFLEMVKATKGITAIFGFIEETPILNFYNSLGTVHDQQVVHVHRKIFLPNYGIFEEKKYFTKGQTFQCFEVNNIRVAPFICGDAWDPALVNLGAMDYAKLFVISVCSPDNGLEPRIPPWEGWQRLARFYAMIYGVYVVFVNRYGSEGDLRFWGKSEVIDPFGRSMATAAMDQEELLMTELDLAWVREARIALPTTRDQDLNFISHHLNALIEKRMVSDN